MSRSANKGSPCEVGRRLSAALTLAIDAVTAEVTTALEREGLSSLLLKGPSLAALLYDDPSRRAYADADLLVAPGRVEAVEAVLATLGFTRHWGPLEHPGMREPPSWSWGRHGINVDLHNSLAGARAHPQVVWDRLVSDAVEQEVGGRKVWVLSEDARLAHVALHAAHHGPAVAQPLQDLNAALEAFGHARWMTAYRVAQDIEATSAFIYGLSLTRRGREVSGSLGLMATAVSAAKERSGVPLVAGVERLARASRLRDKMALALEELVPSKQFMRWWTPLARRPRGLVAAYAVRLAFLVVHAPAAVVAWRRARTGRTSRPKRQRSARQPHAVSRSRWPP